MSEWALGGERWFVAKGGHQEGRCRGRRPVGDVSRVAVRSLSALGLAGAALATALVVQGPSAEDHGHSAGTRLVTASGALVVGTPSVTLVHQANEMVGMPPSDAHRMGGDVLVPVTLSNTSDAPITYAPHEFRLLVDGKPVEAGGEAAGAPAQELRPHAAITLRLTFGGASLAHGGQLEYAPATGTPVAARLEAVGGGSPATGPSTSGSGSTEHAEGDHDHGAH